MYILELISSGYELTKYLINRVVIQEYGILLGGCLTCEELAILKKMNIQDALMK